MTEPCSPGLNIYFSFLDKESLTSNTTPVHRPQSNATTTDSTISPSSAPTELFDLTTIKTTNIFPTTTAPTSGELLQATETTEGTKSRTTTSIVEANAQANKAHESSSSTILAVSLSLGFCLLAVGVAAAVFFVRWKRWDTKLAVKSLKSVVLHRWGALQSNLVLSAVVIM